MSYLRGRIYAATIDDRIGEKCFLVVSNNQRNRALRIALAVRLTTTPKPPIPSIVALDRSDTPFVGCVLCDDIVELWDEEGRDLGALRPQTMTRVNAALASALALD